jgi:hypothetical protein
VPLDIIDFLETLVETGHEVRRLIEGLLLRNPITGALPVTPAASFNHSSARPSNLSGKVRPRALVVFMLSTSFIFVD